jgi:hypothetical protein
LTSSLDLDYRVSEAANCRPLYEVTMSRLAITLAVSTTLALAAGATAALPGSGPYAGTTSLHSINGFADIVTFKTASGGHILRTFTFGTLGCFGSGAFPVGTDPYADPTNTAVIRSITVKPTGTFTLTAKPTLPDAAGTVTTAVIQGTFATSKGVSGTITISQSDNGDTCGPSKMKFSAQPGTVNSLGLSGG